MADKRRGRHYAAMSRRAVDALLFAGLIVLYVLAARIGLSLDAAAGFASLVWPSSGIALAALLLLGVRFWPAIFIGAFIANLLTGAPTLVALGIGLRQRLGEALVATLLLRRVSGFSVTLENVRSVLSASYCSGPSRARFVSATIGATSLDLGHVRAVECGGRLQELEHAEAGGIGERLETVHEDHDEAPGGEEGAERLGKAEATRKVGPSEPPGRSARHQRSAVI